MKRNFLTLLFLLFLAAVAPEKAAAQNSYKKVTISVIDAFSGKPVEGAEVTFKVLLGKSVKKTNSEGKAFFEMMLIAETLNLNYTVNCPVGARTYKPYSGSITLVSSKDAFEYTAAVQPNSRIVSFKISDDKRQPVAGAAVKLKDDNGSESKTKSDANGIASFDIAPGTPYKNAMLTIAKEGFNEYTIPVEINDQTSQVSVIANLMAKTIAADADLGMPQPKPDLPGPTGNLVITSPLPGYSVAPRKVDVTWGPYTPSCNTNPLTGLPTYISIAVADEKTLMDRISSSCLGAAAEAIDALADLTENILNINTKLNAACTQAFQVKDPKKLIETAGKYPDNLKILQEDAVKTKKAIDEAVEKTKDLFEKMTKLAAGPELYAITCIWEGLQNYAIPESLMTLKKSTEAIGKAKTAMQEKMEAIKKRMESGEALTYADKDLFTNWKDITENIGKTRTGLTIIYSYLSDPKTILPYETQVNLAISTAEKMMGTVMGDCQIRELDRQIKQGIFAGQASLTAARKRVAQMLKAKRTSYDLITEYVNKNIKEEDRGWTKYLPGDSRLQNLPREEYNRWVDYDISAKVAAKDTTRLRNLLIHLGELCSQIQPMADTLNERVKKYEDLYIKGLIALDSCKLDEARKIIKQLQAYENSDCGHFFPKPYGVTKSQELDYKLRAIEESGKCRQKKGPGWQLISLIVDPEKKSGNGCIVTKNMVSYSVGDSKLEFTMTDMPEFISFKDTIIIHASATYSGTADNFGLSLAFSNSGFLTCRMDGTCTVGRVNNVLMNIPTNKATISIFGEGYTADAHIFPQLHGYSGPLYGTGIRIFEAYYKYVE